MFFLYINHTHTQQQQLIMQLIINRLNSNATLPTRGSSFAAGADLYSSEDVIVGAMSRLLVCTGIAVEIRSSNSEYMVNRDENNNPNNYYLRIAPRSGLAVKHCIDIAAGVVDSDYRGEIRVCVVNNSQHPFVIKKGDRIAQMIMERCYLYQIIETTLDLSATERGESGFGSTGV